MVAVTTVPSGEAVLGAGPARVVTRGPTTDKVIALTFDDGWNADRCLEIHDILVEHGVPATWFPNAVYMRSAPRVWRRIAESFPLANHTAHHKSLVTLSNAKIRSELRANEQAAMSITGKPMSKILRPPYGAWNDRVRRVAGAMGYSHMVLWDPSSADTSPRGTPRGVARAALRGGPGSIILMHCGPEVTPKVLPLVIANYACEGYRFATVEALLAGEPGASAMVSCPPPRLSSLAGPGGGATPSGPPDPSLRDLLKGRDWIVSQSAGEAGLAPVPAEVILTLRFGARQASGIVGCDTYQVSYSLKPDGAITFESATRSREPCPDPFAAAEADALFARMLASRGLRLEGDAPELLDAEGVTILGFSVAGRSGPLGDWVVVALSDDSGQLAPIGGDARLTAVFGATGVVRGSTGCREYSGGYSLRETAIMAGPLLVGTTQCGVEQEVLERRFLEALRASAAWEIVPPDRLLLRDADGRELMELVAGAAR